MSKAVDKVMEAIKEGLQQSKDNFWSDLGQELKQQAAHGAHELSAALWTGSGFVMYPRAGKEGQGRAVEGPEAPAPTPEKERDGGMER